MSTEHKNKIRDQIYQDLRGRIFSGELQYGDRLVETQIAEQYGENKAQVRPVLHLLQSKGLVEYIPMKGFMVLGISKEDLFEIAKIREILETAIFEEFLPNASDEDLKEVKLYTKRKIAFLKADLKEEAYKETKATFDKIHQVTPYRRMAVMLQEHREYIDMMIRLAFDAPDDVSKTIQNSTLLCEVFDKRDCENAKRWAHIRYLNVVDKIKRTSMFQSREP